MSGLAERIAALTPAQRRLLEQRLEREGLAAGRRRGGIPHQPDAEHYPLSFGQQRLWFLHQLAPGSPAYNIPFAGRLEGPLDLVLLERSVNEVVRRHEILRTVFTVAGELPVQKVLAGVELRLAVDDLTGLPADEREVEAERRVNDEARVPFDLATPPLVRVRVLRLAPEVHTLLVTMPHIVTDAWSMAVFFREVPVLYEAFAEGRPSPLPELAIQFRDYAIHQRQTMTEASLERLAGHWRQALSGAPPSLELPADFPRPPVHRFRGRRHAVDLPREVVGELERLGQGAGATPFMTLLAVFAVLLQRYTGQDDLLVGSPVATRGDEETHGLIGFFINTLVFRVRLRGDPTFRQLLGRVREDCLAAYAHQDMPFEKLLDVLGIGRDASRPPLVQATLVLQNVHIPTPEFRGLRLTQFQQTDTRSAKFDLLLGLWESATGTEGWIEYNTDLFRSDTIERFGLHLRQLAQAIVAAPDRHVSELSLLTSGQREWLVEQGRGGRPAWPRESGLAELFAEQARLHAHRTALVSARERLDYAELDRRANRLAHRLRRLGAGCETRIALCLERSVEAIVAILAVIKAGGAYVPLDPEDPPDRLRLMIEESGADMVLTTARHAHRLPPGRSLVVLDVEAAAIAGESAQDPGVRSGGEALAYVLSTSGSTGRPKGVAVPHRAVVRLVLETDYVRFGADAVFLQLAPLAFDASTFEIWGALLHGATLVIYPPEPPSLPRLRAILAEHGVTTLWLTAGLFHLVVDEDVELLRPVRQLLAGGDVLAPARVRRVLAALPGLVLVNGYGPTEGTTFATTHAMRAPDEVVDPVPIGRPIANSEAHVLDERGEPSPIGVPGELHIGGEGLARGYVGHPGLTADRFVPHPFAPSPGARLYRTGDRARVRPDGTIEFMGRVDRQVKLRGYRIEPGEVEAALCADPSIREAVVEVRAGRSGERQLVAYVVPAAEGPFDPAAARVALRDRLPVWMQPGAWVVLDALPLTANGKLDRAALPEPGTTAARGAGVAAAPAGGGVGDASLPAPAEVELARIWREVLHLEHVAPEDDFFALGGDSILGIQVLSRARAAGYALEPVQLFESPTLRALASAAVRLEDGATGDDLAAAAAGAVPEPDVGAVPLTPIHHWFFDQQLPRPDHWNMALRLALASPLEAARLEGALATVVARHDALRLRATRAEAAWSLEVAAAGEGGPVEEVRVPDEPAAREQAIRQATASLHARLDLARGPIVRAALFEDGQGRSFELLLVIHHLAVDAVSWGIVLEDLERAYGAPADGLAALGRPAPTFRRWAARLEALARGGAAQAELEEWVRRVATPPTRLPRDMPGEGRDLEAALDTVWAALDAATSGHLRRESRRAYRAGALDLLLAALADALAGWPGATVGRVDVERHGREPLFEDLDPSRTVGWFTAIVPVRLDVAAGSEPREAIVALKEELRAMPLHGVGYGLLRHLADADTRALVTADAPDVSFNYLGSLDGLLDRSRLFTGVREATGGSHAPVGERPYALEITAYFEGGVLVTAWSFGREVLARATVERAAAAFLAAVQRLVAHCAAADAGTYTPSDFPRARLGRGELERLVSGIRQAEAMGDGED